MIYLRIASFASALGPGYFVRMVMAALRIG